MWITYVCALDLTQQDGPSLHVEAVSEAFASAGHRVTLIAPKTRPVKGVECVDAPMAPGFTAGAKLRSGLRRTYAQLTADSRPDLIYCRGSFPQLVADAAEHGVPTFVEYNGVLANELEYNGVPALKRRRLLSRERRVAQLCAGAIAVDVTSRNGMIACYPELAPKIIVARNGCRVRAFSDHLNAEKDRDPWQGVFVGGFHPWTRLDLVLEAMEQVPEAKLTVIGDGARREEFEAIVTRNDLTSRVAFLGRKAHDEVPRLLAQASFGIAVEPGTFDGGVPLKMGEYLAAGCAPLINGYSGLDFLKDQSLGVLLPLQPTQADIATAIQTSATTEAMNTTESRHSRHDYASKNLSWDRSANEILTFTQAALRQRTGRATSGAT